MQTIIRVRLVEDTWLAEFENDELMGDIAVPTAFTAKHDATYVGERMLVCNPGADVRVYL